MEILNNEIRKTEDLEDGSSVYEVGPPPPKVKENTSSDKNLAESMSEAALKKLSTYLLDGIREDVESRKEWISAVEKAKKYLGFNLEDTKDIPFKEATRTFDITLPQAVINFYATARAEFFPQTGPAGFRLKDVVINDFIDKEGEKRRDRLNNFLTEVDEGYYPDCERSLLYTGLFGSVFKKVYFDKLLNRPISRFILPIDFIVNGDCSSILESTRITHVLHLSKREILLNQQNGIYRDVELKHLKMKDGSDDDEDDDDIDTDNNGIDLSAYSKRTLSPIYEVHTYLDLEEFESSSLEGKNNIPLPYIIAIDKISKEVLYVRENWESSDSNKKAINYFVQYNYLPGFGIYGIGLAHLIGSNAISLTTMLRELIDAGKFKNLPGGLRVKGFGQQKTDINVGPGEFALVDTGGLPLDQAFMPLPYSEPSQTLRELMLDLGENTQKLASTSQLGMMDSKEDIPAVTAIAFLQESNRVQSAVMRSIHVSLDRELKLIDKLLNAEIGVIEGIEIIPISDPTMGSSIQRIMQARFIMELAMQDPDRHYMTEVFKINYQAAGLDQKVIDKILKVAPEEGEQQILPVDPITEYMNILLGIPVKAAIWQNHPAHILSLGICSKRPEIQDKPESMAALMALITEHQAYQYLIEMQQLLGMQLPPLEQLQDPQIQNDIAMAIAGALEESGLAQQAQQPAPPDPNAVWMADVEAKRAETEAKERMANLKAETDIFKTQMDFEKEKARIESDEDIAQLKAETELTKQEYDRGQF